MIVCVYAMVSFQSACLVVYVGKQTSQLTKFQKSANEYYQLKIVLIVSAFIFLTANVWGQHGGGACVVWEGPHAEKLCSPTGSHTHLLYLGGSSAGSLSSDTLVSGE